MKIVLTGATGFIGKSLLKALSVQGHQLIALARDPSRLQGLPGAHARFPVGEDAAHKMAEILTGADAIIHLAGESIASKRLTPERKKILRDSRILTTRLVVDALSKLEPPQRPGVLISASAIGYYGEGGEEALDENRGPGSDFLALLVRDWESEASRAESLGVRVVMLRSGLVLGRGGGVLEQMPPTILGNGQQWMSWIHLSDLQRFIAYALAKTEVQGPFNMTSPHPVRNVQFARILAHAKHWPFAPPVPRIALTLALGEIAQFLMMSQRALPLKALASGFLFAHPDLESALNEIMAR